MKREEFFFNSLLFFQNLSEQYEDVTSKVVIFVTYNNLLYAACYKD